MKNKVKNVVAKYLKERVLDGPLINLDPKLGLVLIVVVPCFKEELEDVLNLCHSLNGQTNDVIFELIIVVNNPIEDQKAYQLNRSLLDQVNLFDQFNFPIHFIDKTNIENRKKAGVGLARKIGLDEGLRRFSFLEKNGILVCLDADCTVANDYLIEVVNFFKYQEKLNACSIGFKHRLEEINDNEMLKAIIQYELHLRYYIQIQDWIGLPYAFQTVGSAMAVRSNSYAAQGGMPVLKAGEDFYFLHKFIGTAKCGNLSRPLVYPSGRISDRVPFGTGRAVGELLGKDEGFLSYHPYSFNILQVDLNVILSSYPKFKNICVSVSDQARNFYKKVNLEAKLEECVVNTTDKFSFTKRFFRWFDAFLLMKYVHYMRDEHYENINILDAVNLFTKIKGEEKVFENELDALKHFQSIDYPNEVQV